MRPKTIKHGIGEIVFKNIPVEERNEIIEKIKGPKMNAEWDEEKEEYILVPETKEEKVIEEKDLPDVGYSLVRVGNMWSAIEIKLNTESKEALVVNITPLHTNKVVASERFRIKFCKFWF